jgi:hypothetical protein
MTGPHATNAESGVSKRGRILFERPRAFNFYGLRVPKSLARLAGCPLLPGRTAPTENPLLHLFPGFPFSPLFVKVQPNP